MLMLVLAQVDYTPERVRPVEEEALQAVSSKSPQN